MTSSVTWRAMSYRSTADSLSGSGVAPGPSTAVIAFPHPRLRPLGGVVGELALHQDRCLRGSGDHATRDEVCGEHKVIRVEVLQRALLARVEPAGHVGLARLGELPPALRRLVVGLDDAVVHDA